MPELPRISGDEAIRIFKKLGFHETRRKGSHVVMRRGDKGCFVPRHKELGRYLAQCHQAGWGYRGGVCRGGEKISAVSFSQPPA